ncbi:MAG: FixH family protein [Sulfurovum sp.]|uniref:FixH family protein n=1 Tax=Sulfurovum sp. TaxID=1969726 RepID=UPI002867D353|nr:FixH family protein [Sulfurovum sp.]MCO4844662.1 FixH family protein [Sulfurovum sp.]
MAKNSEKTYWPHMILGFLVVGITLSYWTVKSASSMPVQESNQYMLKYQMADININQIMEKKIAFDKAFTIHILDAETMVMTDNVNSNRPQLNPVKLSQGSNVFSYEVVAKDGTKVSDANVTFLLTQPHSRKEDKLFINIPYENEKYQIRDVEVTKAGRYTLQLRAEVGDTMGYSEVSAYLKP